MLFGGNGGIAAPAFGNVINNFLRSSSNSEYLGEFSAEGQMRGRDLRLKNGPLSNCYRSALKNAQPNLATELQVKGLKEEGPTSSVLMMQVQTT